MINQNQFHTYYSKLRLGNVDCEEFLFIVYQNVIKSVFERSKKNPKIYYIDNIILDYVVQEYRYYAHNRSDEALEKNIHNEGFIAQFVDIVSDKVLFNEIIPYHDVSLLSHQSPVISTMELNINFILDRISAIKDKYREPDILLDMFRKAVQMFKCLNYQLSSGFETEAFSTWRTIHELECVIKVIADNPDVIPVYRRHMDYSDAFRNKYGDKELQQATIDELKEHMREHDLKSKDMKKYIEYGWLYSVKDVEVKINGFKLNFRNGLEAVAGLSNYSYDYEMSSEVAHSSPLLIYSNKVFFRYIATVRSYESFIRLENVFFSLIGNYPEVDFTSYINMRNRYNGLAKDVLSVEYEDMKKYIDSHRTAAKKNITPKDLI